jgi:hypothetical protein
LTKYEGEEETAFLRPSSFADRPSSILNLNTKGQVGRVVQGFERLQGEVSYCILSSQGYVLKPGIKFSTQPEDLQESDVGSHQGTQASVDPFPGEGTVEVIVDDVISYYGHGYVQTGVDVNPPAQGRVPLQTEDTLQVLPLGFQVGRCPIHGVQGIVEVLNSYPCSHSNFAAGVVAEVQAGIYSIVKIGIGITAQVVFFANYWR